MSIKAEILTLQHIRIDLQMKISQIESEMRKFKMKNPDAKMDDYTQSFLQDMQEILDEIHHELQHNSHYTRTYPALCAIGMPEYVKAALLGELVTDPENEENSESGKTDS